MNPNYTELKADTLSNPFRKAQGSKVNEIMRNKGSLVKYVILLGLIIGIIICSIILITKSSQLKQIAREKENYENQIKEIQRGNEELLKDIRGLEETVNKLTKEKNDLAKEEAELKKKKEELTQQNSVNYDQEIQMLQDQLEAATKRYDQMKKDNPHIDKDKTELEALVKKYKAELASLQEEYDRLKNELNNKNNQPQEVEIQSKILGSAEREKFFALFRDPPRILRVLYQATPDTFTTKHFHNAVTNIRNTLVVMELSNSHIIGGYTGQSWDGEGFKEDPSAFLFNLQNNKIYPIENPREAIYCSNERFPIFGTDLVINIENVESNFPSSYGRGRRLELTNNEAVTSLRKLEVFHLVFN